MRRRQTMSEFALLITDDQLERLLVEDLGRPVTNKTRPTEASVRAIVTAKILPQLQDKLNKYSDRR